MKTRFCVISSTFHNRRVLSCHLTMAAATRAFERYDARHVKECSCGAPSIIDTTAAIRRGDLYAGGQS